MRLPVLSIAAAFAGAIAITACGGSSSKPTAKPTASPVGKTRDRTAECVAVFAHLSEVMGRTTPIEDAEIQKCLAENLSVAQVQCFKDARTIEDGSACAPSKKKLGEGESEMADSRDIEVHTVLSQLTMAARAYQVEHGNFPKGDTGLVPGPPRCEDDHSARHQPSAADFAGPIWKALEYAITDPYFYSYRYQSDGRSFTITAQGDADCNGRLSTFTQRASISASKEYLRSDLEVDSPEE